MSNGYLEEHMREFVIVPVILETVKQALYVNKFGFLVNENRQFKDNVAELAIEFTRRITREEYLIIYDLFRDHLGWDLNFDLIIASGFVDNSLSYRDITDFVKNGIKWVYHHNIKHPLDVYREWGAYALYNEYMIKAAFPEIQIKSDYRLDMELALEKLSSVMCNVPSYKECYRIRDKFPSIFNGISIG